MVYTFTILMCNKL